MLIERSIAINTTPDKVWQVFTNPETTRKMGGCYKSEWKPGTFFGWQNIAGDQITYGRILDYQPEQLLKYELYKGKDQHEVLSVITYSIAFENNHTILLATEDLDKPLTGDALAETLDGWNTALNQVKTLAESL